MARRKNTKAAGTYAIDLTKRPGLQGFTAIYWNGESLETYNVVTGWYCTVDATHWMAGGYEGCPAYCCDCTEAADAAADDAITDMLAYPTLKDWVNDAPAPAPVTLETAVAMHVAISDHADAVTYPISTYLLNDGNLAVVGYLPDEYALADAILAAGGHFGGAKFAGGPCADTYVVYVVYGNELPALTIDPLDLAGEFDDTVLDPEGVEILAALADLGLQVVGQDAPALDSLLSASAMAAAELAAKEEAARLSLAGLTNALTDDARLFGFIHPIEVVTVGNLPGAVALVCNVEDDRASRQLLTHIGATVVCGQPAYTKRPGKGGEVTWLLDSYGFRRRTQTPTITLPEVPTLGIASILDAQADAFEDADRADEHYAERYSERADREELAGIYDRAQAASAEVSRLAALLTAHGYIPGGVGHPAVCQHMMDTAGYCGDGDCAWY